MFKTKRLINPPRYETLLRGSAPCNYTLNSRTNYRTLARENDIHTSYQIEAFYKYDYGNFKIDWAFRSFEFKDDYRMFNLVMFTDRGIYSEDITRSILDNHIFMRWTVFVSKMIERPENIFITNEPGTKKVIWFIPKELHIVSDEVVVVIDTEGNEHVMTNTETLRTHFERKLDYVDVDETNYIPVYWFHMWYTLF